MLNTSALEEIKKVPGYENKRAFSGAFATKPSGRMAARPVKCVAPGTNKKHSLDYIIDAVGLKDGMTISFHHSLRNGDAVMYQVISEIAKPPPGASVSLRVSPAFTTFLVMT